MPISDIECYCLCYCRYLQRKTNDRFVILLRKAVVQTLTASHFHVVKPFSEKGFSNKVSSNFDGVEEFRIIISFSKCTSFISYSQTTDTNSTNSI